MAIIRDYQYSFHLLILSLGHKVHMCVEFQTIVIKSSMFASLLRLVFYQSSDSRSKLLANLYTSPNQYSAVSYYEACTSVKRKYLLYLSR